MVRNLADCWLEDMEREANTLPKMVQAVKAVSSLDPRNAVLVEPPVAARREPETGHRSKKRKRTTS
jgi:hypothetical protein